MASIRNSKVLAWRPTGVADTNDSTLTGPNTMARLTNLVPSTQTRGVFVPRPASMLLANSSNYSTGLIPSVYLILGDVVFGMFNYIFYDIPFAYNLLTNQFYQIYGSITATTVPLYAGITGDWAPPTMDSIGAYVLVTHPGFKGISNGFFGYFNISNLNNITWGSGNLTGNPLVGVPTAVAVFDGRAYYAVGNAVQASDPYLPLQQTNAGQVLTAGDNSPITALAGLPLNNTQGGIIQSLMCFKGVSNIYQITGDYSGTPSQWSINSLNVATGTLAPNTICSTPKGLAFLAPDGVRILDFNATVNDPIGSNGTGICAAIQNQNITNPSRACAAYNMQTLRIAVRKPDRSLNNSVEYWYNFALDAWTGAHTLPTSFMQPYKSTFITACINGPS